MKLFIIIFVCFLNLISFASSSYAHNKCDGVATFYQPLILHKDWSEDDWNNFAKALNSANTKEIFVQWTYADGANLSDVISKLFDVSKKHNFKIWLGLVLDKNFWQVHERNSELLKVHFRRNEFLIYDVIVNFKETIKDNSNFAGWYITDEIDDSRWLEASRKAILIEHLNKLTSHLKDISTNYPVAISGFSNGKTSPTVLAEFWKDVLNQSGIDFLLFQDGIGAKKLSVREFVLYRDELLRILNPEKIRFIVEAFVSESNGEQEFKAKPINPADYKTQFNNAFIKNAGKPILFSVPDFFMKSPKLMENHKDVCK